MMLMAADVRVIVAARWHAVADEPLTTRKAVPAQRKLRRANPGSSQPLTVRRPPRRPERLPLLAERRRSVGFRRASGRNPSRLFHAAPAPFRPAACCADLLAALPFAELRVSWPWLTSAGPKPGMLAGGSGIVGARVLDQEYAELTVRPFR